LWRYNPRRGVEGFSMVWAVLNSVHGAALSGMMEGQSSDRIVAILGGGMLDNSLRYALEQRFRQTATTNEKLFRIGGPLGNTVPKVDLAYQLYIFEKPMRNAMHGIIEIRNLFAHQLDMTFSDKSEKFTRTVAKLVLHEGRTHYPTSVREWESADKLEPTDSVRGRFLVNLQICLLHLMNDEQQHLPWSNAPLISMKQKKPDA
jgi:hypothetical protein